MRPRARGSRSKSISVLCVAVAAFASSACTDDESGPRSDRLELWFDDLERQELEPGFVTLGELDGRAVDGELLLHGVEVVPLGDDPVGGHALSLPGVPGAGPAVAALKINPPDPDVFSPGESGFTFGADIALDEAEGGDRGANILQRGLFSDPGQYKIQVDRGVPSCRVAGTGGDVLVRGEAISPGQWHRVRCTRVEDTVTLAVQPREADQWGKTQTYTGSGSIGIVEMPATTPISVGAKLSAAGALVPARPDQFHGLIDAVVVEVG